MANKTLSDNASDVQISAALAAFQITVVGFEDPSEALEAIWTTMHGAAPTIDSKIQTQIAAFKAAIATWKEAEALNSALGREMIPASRAILSQQLQAKRFSAKQQLRAIAASLEP